MRAKQQENDSAQTADALAKQNPALVKPMDVKRAAAVEGGPRVEGLIAKDKIDQIVESCRVGVNRAGATEMQFDLKSEVLGGLTTFMTMVYIVFVNPQLLSGAGMVLYGILALLLGAARPSDYKTVTGKA